MKTRKKIDRHVSVFIDVKKICAVLYRQHKIGTTSETSFEHHTLDGFFTSETVSPSYLQLNITSATDKKSTIFMGEPK